MKKKKSQRRKKSDFIRLIRTHVSLELRFILLSDMRKMFFSLSAILHRNMLSCRAAEAAKEVEMIMIFAE